MVRTPLEVAVIDQEGAGEMYLRDLEFESNDWFYVGMADMTISPKVRRTAAWSDLQGENSPYDLSSNFDGRLAFFVDGKFGDHWRLTASADTREGPMDELFSNFLDKTRMHCSGASTLTTTTRPSAMMAR